MTWFKRILVSTMIAVTCVAGYWAYDVLFVISHLREAYAAWDTGTLLVEYMKQHDRHWPTSWDELVTVIDCQSGKSILMRGSQAGDVVYAKALREQVAVDWTFNIAHPSSKDPVTEVGGRKFPIMWDDPNRMVREFLAEPAATRPAMASPTGATQ